MKTLIVALAVSSLLVACNSTFPPTPQAASPSPSVTTTPSPSIYQQALNKGMEAATATQTAKTRDDWTKVSQLWQAAINFLGNVPESDPNYAAAQQKIKDYERNMAYARQAHDQAPAPSPAPFQAAPNTIYYLAVNDDSPAPDDPIPVADKATMQQMITAAQSGDRSKFNQLANSSAASLIQGGGIVDVLSRSNGMIEVKLRSWDLKGNDLSGQVRWTDERFLQNRKL